MLQVGIASQQKAHVYRQALTTEDEFLSVGYDDYLAPFRYEQKKYHMNLIINCRDKKFVQKFLFRIQLQKIIYKFLTGH